MARDDSDDPLDRSDHPVVHDEDDAPIDLRVDRLFEKALRQQLSDQQALNAFVERIDEALIGVRNELSEVRVSLARAMTTTREEASAGAREAIAKAARAEMTDAVDRIDQRMRALRTDVADHVTTRLSESEQTLLAALRNRDDGDRLAAGPLLKRMEELRDQLEARFDDLDVAAAQSLTDASAKLHESVSSLEGIRTSIEAAGTAAVTDITEVVSTLGEQQQEAVEAVRASADKIAEGAVVTREGVTMAVDAALETLRTHSAELSDHHRSEVLAAVQQLQQLLSDTAADMRTESASLQSQAAEHAQQLQQLLSDTAADMRTESASLQSQAAEHAQHLRETVGDVSDSLREDTASTRAAISELVNTSTSNIRERLAQVDEVVGNLSNAVQTHAGVSASTLEDISQRTKRVVDEATAAIDDWMRSQTSTQQSLMADAQRQAAVLIQTTSEALRESLLEPLTDTRESAATALRDVSDRVTAVMDQLRSDLEEQLAGVAQRATSSAVEAVRESITGSIADIAAPLADIRSSADAATRAAGDAAEAVTILRDIADGVADRLSAVLTQRLDDLETTTAAEVGALRTSLAGVTESVNASIITAGHNAAGHVADEMAGASKLLEDMGAEVRDALVMTAEEDRARIREALLDLRASSDAVARELHAAMAEQTDAARAAAAAEASSLARSVRIVQAQVDEVSEWLGTSMAQQADAARSAADVIAERLQEALDSHVRAIRAAAPDMTDLADEIADLRRVVDALREERGVRPPTLFG